MRGTFWTIIHFTVLLVSSFASPETTEVPKTTTVISTTNVPSTMTTVPSTTTTVHSTTTTVPSTTTMLPNTTTPAPSTTTSVPSTTTNFPTSTQPIDEGKWNVTDGNVTCIIAEIRAEFSITQGNLTVAVPLPSDAVVDPRSTCNLNSTQILVLSFENDILEFVFEKDSDTVSVKKITFFTRIGGLSIDFSNDTKLFPVKLGNSYMCRSTDKVPLNNPGMEVSITLKIEGIRWQAFKTNQEDEFGNAEECTADEMISDIVPIAVACALAILIVIVLIAYLVGRRRNRQKGYTSV